MADSPRIPATPGARRRWVGLAIAALVVAGLLLAGRELAAFVPAVARRVDELGTAGPALFILVYAIAAVALIPASLLTVAAGITFGVARGVAYVIVGASAGAVASFLIARYVARSRVERWLAGDPRLSRIDRAVAASGLRIMLLMRLSPAFPFGLQNYALGLTRVHLRDFVLALVGMIPGTLLYVYAGAVAGEVATAVGGVTPPRSAGYYGVLALGLVATVAVAVIVARIARDALRADDAPAPEAPAGDVPASDAPGGTDGSVQPGSEKPVTGSAKHPQATGVPEA